MTPFQQGQQDLYGLVQQQTGLRAFATPVGTIAGPPNKAVEIEEIIPVTIAAFSGTGSPDKTVSQDVFYTDRNKERPPALLVFQRTIDFDGNPFLTPLQDADYVYHATGGPGATAAYVVATYYKYFSYRAFCRLYFKSTNGLFPLNDMNMEIWVLKDKII